MYTKACIHAHHAHSTDTCAHTHAPTGFPPGLLWSSDAQLCDGLSLLGGVYGAFQDKRFFLSVSYLNKSPATPGSDVSKFKLVGPRLRGGPLSVPISSRVRPADVPPSPQLHLPPPNSVLRGIRPHVVACYINTHGFQDDFANCCSRQMLLAARFPWKLPRLNGVGKPRGHAGTHNTLLHSGRSWSPVSAAVEPRLLHRHLCTWLVFLSLISTRLSKKFVLNINLASVLYLRCFPPQVAVFSTSFMDTLLRSRHPSCEFRVSGLFWFRNLSLFHDYSVSQHLPTFMCNDLFPSAGTSPA